MGKLFKSFWFNVLIILLICFGIYFAFFSSLSRITGHGKELLVPKVKLENAKVAISELESLGFNVEIDSIYDTLYKPSIVIDIQPEEGSSVKKGRTIFLKINKVNPPEVEMPNLLNLSLRSAVLLLKTSNLVMGDTTYKPDMAQGSVLQMLHNGKPINPKTKVFQGATIDLVIGSGYGHTDILVPDLINVPFYEAVQILESMNLLYIEVWDGRISDSSTAVVYLQYPTPKNVQGYPNHILEGENMDIRIRQQPLEIDSFPINDSDKREELIKKPSNTKIEKS
ncbi:MAG TPA: PASTA domain-containing protein [Edaphocola sp.]|nr:PASTA domain-containing protein [Edaphocola sp.]